MVYLLKISKTRCNKYGGYISWDNYPNPRWPIHVDEKGNKIGDDLYFSSSNFVDSVEGMILLDGKEDFLLHGCLDIEDITVEK